MDEREFKDRIRNIALRVVHLCEALPQRCLASTLGKQLLRNGTSIGANYRAACRSKSAADMIPKLAIIEEKADETWYWFDLLVAAKLMPAKRVLALESEIDQVVKMNVASIRTVRVRATNPKSKIQNPK